MCVGIRISIQENLPDLNEVVERLRKSCSEVGAGAIAVFIGFVKGIVDGKKVFELRYEAYEPYASRKLEEIAKSYLDPTQGVLAIEIYHAVGSRRVGDPTFMVVVAGRSRHNVFKVLEEIVERVKHEVPITKLEVREDGEFWVVGDGKRIRRFSEFKS